MLRVIILRDDNCKKDLAEFIKNYSEDVFAVVNEQEIVSKMLMISDMAGRIEMQNDKLSISSVDSVSILNPSEIIHCESNRNYTKFFLSGSRTVTASRNLMEYEKQLARFRRFVRIHKSHLVNIDFVDKYVKKDGGYVVLKDKTKLPVATRKRELLFKEIERL